jgi:hypothetical protein
MSQAVTSGLANLKETSMANYTRISACLEAAQAYLEEEFPGHVEVASENVITVSHHNTCHHVTLQPEFIKKCRNCAHALRESELADHIREVRSQGRRFIVMWHEHGTRVRSTPV